MIWKLLTAIGVGLALWSMLRRAGGAVAGGGARPPAGREVADLTRCPACGAWTDPAAPCDCALPPTP